MRKVYFISTMLTAFNKVSHIGGRIGGIENFLKKSVKYFADIDFCFYFDTFPLL